MHLIDFISLANAVYTNLAVLKKRPKIPSCYLRKINPFYLTVKSKIPQENNIKESMCFCVHSILS